MNNKNQSEFNGSPFPLLNKKKKKKKKKKVIATFYLTIMTFFLRIVWY